MYGRTHDLRLELEQVAQQVWIDDNHRFFLTPDVYELSPDGREQLDELGRALAVCMPGIGRIAAIASNSHLAKNGGWSLVQKSLWNSVPAVYLPLGVQRPNRVPASLKVDLLEGNDGRFYLAEIDGYNERGLGYTILAARMRDVINPEAKTLPGVAKLYAEEVRRFNRGDNLLLIYSDRERFYLPEFMILQEELWKCGVNLHVESDPHVDYHHNKFWIRGSSIDASLLVYHPFIYYNTNLDQQLAQLYQADEIDYLIPPKPFLGSKSILALLRNDDQDPVLEAILLSQIPKDSLESIRRYIPETFLLHRKSSFNGRDVAGYVLKKTVASGMKGTFFAEDPDFFERLDEARRGNYSHVLQREVTTKAREYRFYHPDGELQTARCYTRVIAYYIGRQLADLLVTALPRKAVHGAPDSLMLGTVLTDRYGE